MSNDVKPTRRKSLVLHSSIAAFFILLLPNSTSASLYCPSSYAIVSSDNKFVLVMCSPVKPEYDQGRVFKLPSGQEIDLREKFHTNGVFSLDAFECVQPLNWFADQGELFASRDLKLLVRLNRFAIDSQKKDGWRWCLKFYNNGKEVRQYRVQDLVDLPNSRFLPFTPYGWHSVWYGTTLYADQSTFDDVDGSYYNQFVLVTAPQVFCQIQLAEGNAFLFNADSGEIQQEWRHHLWIKLSLIFLLVFAIFLLALFLFFLLIRKLTRACGRKRIQPKTLGGNPSVLQDVRHLP